MAFDLVIDIENSPGSLAAVTAAVSDAGVNLAAATCLGNGQRAELHILVPHPEAARHSLAVVRAREALVVADDVVDGNRVAAAQPAHEAQARGHLRPVAEDLSVGEADMLDADRRPVEADGVPAHGSQRHELVDPAAR